MAAVVCASACKPTIPLPGTSNASAPALQLTAYPPSNSIVVNDQFRLEPSNGTAPYTYRRISGDGTLTDSGIFTAPAATGSVTLQVSDSLGVSSTFNFTITAGLAITEAPSFELATTNVWTFHTTGGAGTVSFSLISGAGSVTTPGVYTAGAATGTTVLRATDQSAHTADLTVFVRARPQISPTTATIGVTKTATFTTTAGVTPYTYSVVSGGGSFTGNVYTAGSTDETVIVKVTDARGNVSTANITVIGRPQIIPTTLSLAVTNTFTFTATSDFTPYVYSITSGGGTINSTSGLYTAPATVGTTIVRVTDNVGNYTESTVTIVPALQIVPTTITMAVNDVYIFTRTGGVAPYVYSVIGTGTVNATSGSFTAPSSVGTTKVRVTDARGNTSDSTITVNPALVISPTTLTVAANNQYQFTATGGVTPYTFSVASGTGSTTAAGNYTAPSSSGTSTVRVTDAFGNTANAVVTVNPALAIAATRTVIAANNTSTVSATGGVPSYAFSVVSGPGSVNAVSGVYTPGVAGTAVLRATDSFGNTSDVTITVNPSLSITPSPAVVAINENKTFAGVGGVSPYSYQLLTGAGSITSLTGIYTAPGTTGTASVRVTDVLGNTADASITITLLQMTATPSTIAANNTSTAAGVGGSPAYTFSLVSGPGAINATTGVYTPGASGSATLRVTDAVGRTATTTVTINPILTISATFTTIAANDTTTATGANGVGPYTYSLVSGPGSVNSATGVYTPGAAGTGIVRVTDSLSNTANVTITVNPALTISTNRAAIATNNTATVTAANGVPAYSYVTSGIGGSTVSASGVFTPGSAGTATVTAYDALGNSASVTITVSGPLSISPTSINVMINQSKTFSTTGGVSPIVFTIPTGGGSVGSSSGIYTAPASTGSATVRATDAVGNTSDATLTIVQTLQLVISSNTTNYNIRTAANAQGWVDNQDVQLTINSGVIVSSTSTATPSVMTGAFTGSTKVTIINNGSIIGAGGAGGGGNAINTFSPGGNGGHAISLAFAITLNNTSGSIFGGGGGGGAGAAACDSFNSGSTSSAAGGGGGGGAGNSAGTGGAISSGSFSNQSPAATAGNAAGPGSATGGTGGTGASSYGAFNLSRAIGGAGGNGGGYGADGSTGVSASSNNTGCPNYAGSPGGLAGKAVSSNANTVTWLGGQNATQVKGAQN